MSEPANMCSTRYLLVNRFKTGFDPTIYKSNLFQLKTYTCTVHVKIQTEAIILVPLLSQKHIKFGPLSSKIMEKSIFPKSQRIFGHVRVLSLIETQSRG